MPTDCTPQSFHFEACAGRRVVADFNGGAISTDAGGLLLREADRAVYMAKAGGRDRIVSVCAGDAAPEPQSDEVQRANLRHAPPRRETRPASRKRQQRP